MAFTLKEIEEAWKVYESDTVLRVMKDGKWKTVPDHDMARNISGTRAKRVPINEVLDFPAYLDKIWKK